MAESGTENLVADPYQYLKQALPVFAIRLVWRSNDFSIAKMVTKASRASETPQPPPTPLRCEIDAESAF